MKRDSDVAHAAKLPPEPLAAGPKPTVEIEQRAGGTDDTLAIQGR